MRLNDQIDAIFANSDEIGAGILKAYHRAGHQPPLVIGQNAAPIGDYLGMASLDFHLEKIGKIAVDKCNDGDQISTVIPSELIIR